MSDKKPVNENMTVYEKVRSVPDEAIKPITGGRLKGMSDINPMWRIKMLTEVFGMCGIGWKTEIIEKRLEKGHGNEVVCFVDINLYVKVDGEWSEPIFGTGGSSFVTQERNGTHTSDECFKMAYTDAISVACKSLGFAADVYYAKDRTKYSNQEEADQNKPKNAKNTKSNDDEKLLKDCKDKWQKLAGNLDGFDDWHKKKIDEGRTVKQMNAILAHRLLNKNKKESA